MKTVLLFTLLLVVSLTAASAQTSPVDTTNGRSYYILLKDGSHIHGRIVRSDSVMYVVKPRVGPVTYVERALFGSISSTAPVPAADLTYYTQTEATRPGLSRPGQTTLSPNQYVISLSDGTTLSGQVLSQDSSRVVIKTNTIGTVYVPADRVLRMERGTVAGNTARGRLNSDEAYPNIFPQYMAFTPTAYQAEKGRVYYRNSIFYLNQFDVGITNNWSIGAGAFLFPVTSFGWLSTKLSVPLGEHARIAVQGQLIYGVTDFIYRRGFNTNFIQGLLSLGTSQNNVTIGLGFSGERGSSGQLLTVGIVRKVSSLITFISENQLILGESSDTIAKVGGGVRFDRRRHSFDLSANVPITFSRYFSTPQFTLIPWVAYQVRIGQ
ncbi:hypothetical protein J2I47_04315 [Fibrella sp. HMF5335]|uniref:Uncharacterized protein n=1 Tax=Fibrella rubiginis TaxID=2817060 RepID=A0A939GE07_9BACT|nr:hypothetical protein [Fibrella rubiginis]MBO0935765.1 hypothetical protein [Fibrella rubiginis]